MRCEALTSANLKLTSLPTFPDNCSIYFRVVEANFADASDVAATNAD